MSKPTKKKIDDMNNEELLALAKDPNRKWYNMRSPEERAQFYKDTTSPYRPKK